MVCTARHGMVAHIQSVLEGIAFSIADVVGAMVSDSGVPLAAMRVDGGVSQSDILLQVLAVSRY